jgi:carbamate kinase
MPLAVAALGGNAILGGGASALDLGAAPVSLARLAGLGWDLVVTHGNGPQVGDLLLGLESAGRVPALDVIGAQTEGSIGYALQQSLGNALGRAGLARTVASLVTQTVVEAHDPAFADPTKPVGPFFSAERAEILAAERGWRMVEDAGRGWRRAVPSPQPLEIVEWQAIRSLARAGVVTVSAGGGGIPVVRLWDGSLRGVEAVVDKDRASSLLARKLEADLLVIFTAVPEVLLDFRRPGERPLRRLSVAEARAHLAAGQFAAGSMGPKVESAAAFTEATANPAIITSPERLLDALVGTSGTTLHP